MTAASPDWKSSIKPSAKTSVRSIVLPLDGSEQSRTALPVARKLCELYGAALHMTYVGDRPFDVTQDPSRLGLTTEQLRGAVFERRSGDAAEFVARLTRELPEALLVM